MIALYKVSLIYFILLFCPLVEIIVINYNSFITYQSGRDRLPLEDKSTLDKIIKHGGLQIFERLFQNGSINKSISVDQLTIGRNTPGLAIKYVKKGQEIYRVDNKERQLSDGQFLLIRSDTKFLVHQKKVKNPNHGLCININMNDDLEHLFDNDLLFNISYNSIHSTGLGQELASTGTFPLSNLAYQDIFSINASGPISLSDKIRVNNNLTVSYNDSYADYGDGVVIANDAFNFSCNQSYEYTISDQLTANLSAWYASSDLWDGIQYSRPNFSLGTGIKSSLLERKLFIIFNLNDIFYSERFKAESVFEGRKASMFSLDDTRRVSLSVRYVFGNSSVKSRRRKSGDEEEKKRA